jgi:hypothetical protein
VHNGKVSRLLKSSSLSLPYSLNLPECMMCSNNFEIGIQTTESSQFISGLVSVVADGKVPAGPAVSYVYVVSSDMV